MKDYSSYGYMQGPIRTMILEDLNKMGVVTNTNPQKRRSKAGVNSHLSEKYQNECGIYGKPLAELETRPVPGQPYIRVPRLLLRSCNFLLHHLGTEGLFRKSGSVSRQKAIRISLNEGNGIDEESNPHDVASLMKQFLRELPEPLLTYDLYNSFVQSQMLEEEDDRMQAVLLLTLCLPAINRHTLQFLTTFLHTVAEKSSANKMTSSNLAVVITPNVIRATSSAAEGTNIKLETQLMETLIQNSSEIGLVPDDIAHRAQSMILELSGIWGVSEQEAAYKLPLKGKRKRSGSLSGILTSVFKHNKTTTKHSVVLRTRPTLTRKSVSNQDLSVENKMRNIPLHGDLSFSTPCIRTPGPAPRPVIGTPLLTAQRRKALLRQTPVDPRKKPAKPNNTTVNVTDCPSPVDLDPPNKRSKFDMSPHADQVKRKNFKQRLSEGLTSRYRKSRLKRKRSRVHRSSEGSTITTTTTTSTDVTDVTDEQTGCDTPLTDKKKKEKAPVFCFKAKPGSFNDQQKRLTYTAGLSINNINNSEVVVNNCNVEPNLESPVQPELGEYSPSTYVKQLEEGTATPGITDTTISKKKLFPSPRLDVSIEYHPAKKSHMIPISPNVNLHRRRDSYLQSCQLTEEVDPSPPRRRSPRLRRSAPVSLANVQVTNTPVSRRSPRLAGLPLSPPKVRSVSGNSFTAARHSVSLNAINITPQTFSRSSMNKLQPFSPIRVSLNCIAKSPCGIGSRASPGSEKLRSSLSSTKSGTSEGTISQSDLTNTRNDESSDLVNNMTDLFTSREITRLDMSLNVREFDKNFCQQLAQSTEKLAALQQKLNFDSLDADIPEAGSDNIEVGQVTEKVEFEDSVIISKPNTSYKTPDETLDITGINESHMTYITQNMSNFFGNNTTFQLDPDSSRVDFPKFGALPQLPPIIALEENPLAEKSLSSECSDARSMLSELEISECRSRDVTLRLSSDASVTTRNPNTANSCSTLSSGKAPLNLPIEPNCSKNLTESPSAQAIFEDSIKSPPKISRVMMPEMPAIQPDSLALSSTDDSTSQDLVQLSRWIGNSTRNIPAEIDTEHSQTLPKFFDDPNTSANSCGSGTSTGSSDLTPMQSIMSSIVLRDRQSSSSAPGTPLNLPEQQKMDSKRALVVRKQASNLTPESNLRVSGNNGMKPAVSINIGTVPNNRTISADVFSVPSYCPVPKSSEIDPGQLNRDWIKQVLQDDQISSTVQGSPVKENVAPGSTSVTPNLPCSNTVTPNVTPAKPARTPKHSGEVDINKINITPRTKIPRGFTKNLASQWENMNSDTSTRPGTRSTSTTTRKTRIPLRNASRAASNSRTNKTDAVPPQSTVSRKLRTGNQITESVRRADLARAASVKSVVKPTRVLTRTKSDNAGKRSGSSRPAWRL